MGVRITFLFTVPCYYNGNYFEIGDPWAISDII